MAAAARTLQVEELLKRKPGQLSGGQRQRVAIGRAIVRDPEVFLFDEPLSNLDAELRVSMRVEIAKLHRQLGSTMIYVTHDQTEAMTLADKIVVMRAGKVEQAGTPDELYDDPANLFVAGFIGSPRMNFLRGKATSGSDRARRRAEPWLEWAAVTCSSAFAPSTSRSAASDAPLSATVDVVENLGGTRYVYATTGSGESTGGRGPRPGRHQGGRHHRPRFQAGPRDGVLAAKASGCGPTEMTDLELWYKEPAAEWTEALPLGNGRLGAMVFGGVARERLQLNEDTLYAGGPYSAGQPGGARTPRRGARADL